jgi:hypothetical protein
MNLSNKLKKLARTIRIHLTNTRKYAIMQLLQVTRLAVRFIKEMIWLRN